jgi:hypothetical protein
MSTWIEDKNGNRCSVEYFGGQEKAQKALDSLKDCSDCSDCSGCSYCSYCSYCSDCSGCSRCSDCSGCSRCSEKKDISVDIPKIPVVKNLHQKIYAAASQPAALEMNDWHKCDKKHCRAGWVVTLAGAKGKELEELFNTELAAMMIYDVSCPGYKINPARFYDSNTDALTDMKRLAEA